MQHVNRILKTHRINRPVSVTTVVFNNFQDPRSLTLPRFCAWVLAAKLGHAKRDANLVFDDFWESQEVSLWMNLPRAAAFRREFFLLAPT